MSRMRDFDVPKWRCWPKTYRPQTWKQASADGQTHELTNIIGRFYAQQDRRIVLATRYDNDQGASGVAILMELARSLENSPLVPKVGVDIVFLDGGDGRWSMHLNTRTGGSPQANPRGSAYFAEHLDELYSRAKPFSGVLLDDVCDQHLKISKEAFSARNDPAQVEAFWGLAQKIDSHVFENSTGPLVAGDQVPLTEAGIPSFLIANSASHARNIHSSCSAQSMETVARALLNYLLQ